MVRLGLTARKSWSYTQLHRSLVCFFDHDKARHIFQENYYTRQNHPYRGSWLDFEFVPKTVFLLE